MLRTRDTVALACLAALLASTDASAHMPIAHACTLQTPETSLPRARPWSGHEATRSARPPRTMRTYAMQAASLRTGQAHLRAATAQALVRDRNLEGMLGSAIGDIQTMQDVMGMEALVAMRQAHGARGSASGRQARFDVIFEEGSRADFIVSLDYPVARYVVGSARDPQGERLTDARCIEPQNA